MDLQPLFPDKILEQVALDPGYSGHASDVWLVRTCNEEVVVRASRLNGDPANDFWWGAWRVFGIDPRRVFDMEIVNRYLSQLSPIPVPRVIRKEWLEGRPYVLVERMQGRALRSFAGQPPALLEELGTALASIHSFRFDYCGHPAGRLLHSPAEFHTRLAMAMRELVARFHPDTRVQKRLEEMCAAAGALPAPEAGALVMLDMDPSQFLTDGKRLTALVDTEAYVIGPRELDLVALEYVLDAEGAGAVARGYRSVTPLPDLTAVRPVYRYFCRLLSIQGSVDIDRWMAWPELFDQN